MKLDKSFARTVEPCRFVVVGLTESPQALLVQIVVPVHGKLPIHQRSQSVRLRNG